MLGDKTLLEMISLAGGLVGDLGKEIIIFRRRADGATVSTGRLQEDRPRDSTLHGLFIDV